MSRNRQSSPFHSMPIIAEAIRRFRNFDTKPGLQNRKTAIFANSRNATQSDSNAGLLFDIASIDDKRQPQMFNLMIF